MIDEWGSALYNDLLPLGVDLVSVVRGDGPAPGLVLALIDGLPIGSMFMSQRLAKQRGGEWQDYLGKSPEWWVMADFYDALNQNTRATGNWKKGKAPTFDPYPRPGAAEKKKPKTIEDFWRMFSGNQPKQEGGGLWNPVT